MYRDNLERSGNYALRLESVKKYCKDSKFHLAICLFKWRETPEGLEFWKQIYNTIKQYKGYSREEYETQLNDRRKKNANSKTTGNRLSVE
jgi:hypothetical protein